MSGLETRRGTENALGYASKKTLDLKPNDLEGYCAMFDPDGQLKRRQAPVGDLLESERWYCCA